MGSRPETGCQEETAVCHSSIDGGLPAFAGLWETWKNRTTGQRLHIYTILTTDPNPLIEPIHDRMPLTLAPKDYEHWLAPTDPAHLPLDLLRPYPAEELTAWKISSAVGNPRNDGQELIAPIPLYRDKSVEDLEATREVARLHANLQPHSPR
jgi:putative SOS response-associated peptidase YedK